MDTASSPWGVFTSSSVNLLQKALEADEQLPELDPDSLMPSEVSPRIDVTPQALAAQVVQSVTLPYEEVIDPGDPNVLEQWVTRFEAVNFSGDPIRKDLVVTYGFNQTDTGIFFRHQWESYFAPIPEERVMEHMLYARGANNAWIHRPYQINVNIESGFTHWFMHTDVFTMNLTDGTQMFYTDNVGTPASRFFFALPIESLKPVQINTPVTPDAALEIRQPTTLSTDGSTRVGITIRNQAPANFDGKTLDSTTPIIALSIENQLLDGAVALQTGTGAVEFGDTVRIRDGYRTKAFEIRDAAGIHLTTPAFDQARNLRIYHDNLGGKFHCTYGDYIFYDHSGTMPIMQLEAYADEGNPQHTTLKLQGTLEASRISITQTPTTASVTPTHAFIITINGSNYYVPIAPV